MIVNKYQGNGGGGSYTLPVATATRLGGVKIGDGLSIDSAGILSVSGGTAGDSRVLKFSQTFPANPDKGDVVAKRSIRTGWSIPVGESANALYWKFPEDSLQTPANVGKIAVESGYTFTVTRDSEGTSFTFAREDDASINAVITEDSTEGTLDANGDGRTLQFNWNSGNEFGVRVMADAVEDIIPIELVEAPSLIAYTDGIWQFDGTDWVLQSIVDPNSNIQYFDANMFDEMSDSERSAWFDYFVGRAKAGDYGFGLYYLDRRYPDDYGRLTMDFVRMPLANVDGGFNGIAFAGTEASADNVRCLWARLAWNGSWEFNKDTYIHSFEPNGFSMELDGDTLEPEGGFDDNKWYMMMRGLEHECAPGSYYSFSQLPLYIASHFDPEDEGRVDYRMGTIKWANDIQSEFTEEPRFGGGKRFAFAFDGSPEVIVRFYKLNADEGEELPDEYVWEVEENHYYRRAELEFTVDFNFSHHRPSVVTFNPEDPMDTDATQCSYSDVTEWLDAMDNYGNIAITPQSIQIQLTLDGVFVDSVYGRLVEANGDYCIIRFTHDDGFGTLLEYEVRLNNSGDYFEYDENDGCYCVVVSPVSLKLVVGTNPTTVSYGDDGAGNSIYKALCESNGKPKPVLASPFAYIYNGNDELVGTGSLLASVFLPSYFGDSNCFGLVVTFNIGNTVYKCYEVVKSTDGDVVTDGVDTTNAFDSWYAQL